MCTSLALVLLQSMVMVAVLVETSFPRCVSDDDCRAGTFCAPTTFWAAWNPGMCVDCDLAPSLVTERWPGRRQGVPQSVFAEVAGAMTLDERRAGLAHRNETDAMPGRCDQLVLDRAVLSWASLIVLCFVVSLVMLPAVAGPARARASTSSSRSVEGLADPPTRRALVTHAHEMAQHTRQLVLPALVVGTTAGLLVSGPMSATNILLNGLAIGFATSVDEMFAMVVRTPATAAAAAAAFDAIAEREATFRRTAAADAVARRERDARARAHAHTAFIGALTVALLALLLETEQLMAFAPVRVFARTPAGSDALRGRHQPDGAPADVVRVLAGFVFPLVGHYRLVTLADGLKGGRVLRARDQPAPVAGHAAQPRAGRRGSRGGGDGEVKWRTLRCRDFRGSPGREAPPRRRLLVRLATSPPGSLPRATLLSDQERSIDACAAHPPATRRLREARPDRVLPQKTQSRLHSRRPRSPGAER